jgi:type II secretory pathway pseudopilin PulG
MNQRWQTLVRQRRGRRGGFTMVELCVAATLLVFGILAIVGAVVASQRLLEVNREGGQAFQAARARAEELADVSISDAFAAYNADPSDDPFGPPGSAPGRSFDVPGLEPMPDDADGRVGEVIFPAIDVGAGVLAISESYVDGALGMPRDLDGDNVLSGGAVAPAALVALPVRVRVRWRGAAGERSFSLDSVLIRR